MDLLLERGVLSDLSPLMRPYRRIDVARAVLAADEGAVTASERGWLDRLRRELSVEIEILADGSPPTSVSEEIQIDGIGMTQSHRDALRPEGASRVEGGIEGDFRFTLPGVVAESRLRSDSYYWDDPQFRPDRVAENRFGFRAEDAYVEVQGRYLRVMLGRLYRNWAPARVEGALLSDYAYSYDQVSVWAGTDRLSLSLIVTRLDDFPGNIRRYVAWHRFDVRLSDDLALWAGEAVLYGGQNRAFELEFLNPLNVWVTESENQRGVRESPNNNWFGATGFWWRANPSLITFGELMVDDFKVDETAQDGTRFALYAGVVLPRLADRAAGRITYSLVSSLAYRTFTAFELYTFRGLGLGRDFADYDHLVVEADFFPRTWLILTPRVEILRRGEGDFREPFPPNIDNLPRLHIGTVETTARVSIGGSADLDRGLRAEWDGGWSWVWNEEHTDGARDTEFVGWARLSWRW